MFIRAIALIAFTLMLPLAAQAAPNCYVPGQSYSIGTAIGEVFSKEERDRYNLMQLKRMGVDATRAEIWGGCIRAFVRKPEGGQEMQFFHPATYARVG